MIKAIAHIASDFGAANFSSVRVMTAGVAGEISYPGGGTYWAYDANASGGADRPSTIPARPFPTWKPGDNSLSVADIRTWLDWYLGALADAVDFQVLAYEAAGFTGPFHPVQPGLGVKPSGVESAINSARVNQKLLGQGVAWYQLFGKYKTRAKMTAYTSSLAEKGMGQDCKAANAVAAPTSAAVDAFDVGRYMAWIGTQYGVRGAGENPGCCGTGYGIAMLQSAARVADSCHFSYLYWAHESQLNENGAHGVTLKDYADLIAQYGGPSPPAIRFLAARGARDGRISRPRPPPRPRA